jgi:hypothetical protein
MAEQRYRIAKGRFLRDVAFVALASALAWLVLGRVRDHSLDGKLGSDEPEWIAISVLHFAQITSGGPPAGSDLPVEVRPSGLYPNGAASPAPTGPRAWQDGVQATTFGYMNPCLPKLIWGVIFAASGHRQASPYAFRRFHAQEPARRELAWKALLPVEPLARRTVQALAALTSALVALAALRGVDGRTGWLAAAAAFALWLASPLVHNTAGVVRTDFFMMPWVLLGLVLALGSVAGLSGVKGARTLIALCLVLGLLAGLATASKLNGALLLLCAGVWVPWLWSRAGDGRPGFARGPLVALCACGALSFLVFLTINPRLWSEPWGGVRDILERWDSLIAYFHNHLGPRTGVEVAHGPIESVSLYVRKTFARDEAIGAWTGVPWLGAAATLAGLGALVLRAFRSKESSGLRAGILALFALVFVGGTALWLPLDWERFYLTGLPAIVLLQAVGGALLVRALVARMSRRQARTA